MQWLLTAHLGMWIYWDIHETSSRFLPEVAEDKESKNDTEDCDWNEESHVLDTAVNIIWKMGICINIIFKSFFTILPSQNVINLVLSEMAKWIRGDSHLFIFYLQDLSNFHWQGQGPFPLPPSNPSLHSPLTACDRSHPLPESHRSAVTLTSLQKPQRPKAALGL